LSSSKNEGDIYLDREISWLFFNERVIEESRNNHNPLLERLKFLSISAGNLDEFITVRVAGLKNQIRLGVKDDSGIASQKIQTQLNKVYYKSEMLVSEQRNSWDRIKEQLVLEDVLVVSCDNYSPSDVKYIKKYIKDNIIPDVKILDLGKETSRLIPVENLGLTYVAEILNKKESEIIIIPIPNLFNRMIILPADKNNGSLERFALLEEILLSEIFKEIVQKVYDGGKISQKGLMRIFRDSELEISDKAEDLVKTFKKALKNRKKGNIIHVSVDFHMSMDIRNVVIKKIGVEEDRVEQRAGLLDLRSIGELYDIEKGYLKFCPMNIRFPERIDDFGGDCFSAIDAKDIVIHHPYESFDVVVQFIKQATKDPTVIKIKQTLYRTSNESPIVKALIMAANAGKKVTVVVELKARFDEESNIAWGRELEKAGAKVIYGVANMKVHAKMSMVVRNVRGKEKRYVHFGTGNYHTVTAKIYSDLSYFTCDEAFCCDAEKMFDYIERVEVGENVFKPKMKKLVTSPFGIKDKIISDIKNEIRNAKKSLPSGIWLKMNALVDKDIIDSLYRASEAGVNIVLVVRGVCCLRAGVEGLSENIKVKSVVGRFLEHSRIYCFADGKEFPSKDTKLYISSADMMPRNLERRIELLVPIDNSTVHEQILSQIMLSNIRDEKQSWYMQPNGVYRRGDFSSHSFSAHEYFISNPSLSGRGSAIKDDAGDEMLHCREITQQISKVAVVDIGSNSVRLVVYDGLKRIPLPVYNEKVLCGLARGMEKTKKLNERGVILALSAMDRFMHIIRSMGTSDIFVFATSAVRDSEDGEEFASHIESRYDLKVRILSDKEEPQYAALGIMSAFFESKGVVGDLGGGSLDLASFNEAKPQKNINVENCESFPIGPLRLQTITKGDVEKARQILDYEMKKSTSLKVMKDSNFYAVGGGFRALAKIHMARVNYSLNIIEHYSVKPARLMETIAAVPQMSKFEICKLSGATQKRAEIISFAALTLEAIIKNGKPSNIIFSAHGVREGMLFDKLKMECKGEDALIACCKDIMDHISPDYGSKCTEFGENIFEWMDGVFVDEDAKMARLRKAACILSKVAWAEHTSYRAEVAFKWVLNSEISAVTHSERMFLALALYHRYKSEEDDYTVRKALVFLNKKEIRTAKYIGLLMKLGYRLSGGTSDIITRSKMKVEDGCLKLNTGVDGIWLINEDMEKRLKKIAKEMGLKSVINSEKDDGPW